MERSEGVILSYIFSIFETNPFTINHKKALSIIVLVISSLSIHAQEMDKKMREHLKEVEKSKEKGSLIWDIDTVYNAGDSHIYYDRKNEWFFATQ